MEKRGRPKTRVGTTTVVGQRIADIRNSRDGMKQGKLAKLAGISQGALSDIESGETKELMADTLFDIADALGVNPRVLLRGDQRALDPDGITIEERSIINLYQRLNPQLRVSWIAAGQAMLATAPDFEINPKRNAHKADGRRLSATTNNGSLETGSASSQRQYIIKKILEDLSALAKEDGSPEILSEISALESEANEPDRPKTKAARTAAKRRQSVQGGGRNA